MQFNPSFPFYTCHSASARIRRFRPPGTLDQLENVSHHDSEPALALVPSVKWEPSSWRMLPMVMCLPLVRNAACISLITR